jgi:hypothetical protein
MEKPVRLIMLSASIATAALLLLATPVMAQTSAGANSGSRAISNSGVDVTINTGRSGAGRTGTGAGRTGRNGSSGTNSSDPAGRNGINGTNSADPSGGGNYTQTLRNTPEVIAPSIVGGNPCTVGASGGVSLPGFGLAVGGSWEGKGCERRQLAALLYNMGHDRTDGTAQIQLQDAAVEVLCENEDVRTSLRNVGRPCIIDRPAITAPTVAVTQQPHVIPAPPWHRADWCDTSSLAEQRAHAADCIAPGKTS